MVKYETRLLVDDSISGWIPTTFIILGWHNYINFEMRLRVSFKACN